MDSIFLVLFIPYCEVVFSISTTKCTNIKSIALMLLFSFAYSLILSGISSLIENKKVRIVFSVLILSVIPMIYYAEYLVYSNFKIFYDVNTVVNGAGGALTDFMSDILRLIFCFNGISRLILLYLPLAIYVFVSRVLVKNKDVLYGIFITSAKLLFCGAVIIYMIAIWSIYFSNTHKLMYDKEYNYQAVVENMGFATGLRLDIKRLMFVSGNDSFEYDIADVSNDESLELLDTIDEEDETPVELAVGIDAALMDNREISSEEMDRLTESFGPKDYGVNAYDIDFEALAETTTGINKELDYYVASLEPSNKNKYTGLFKGKNLIFITAEAFSGSIIDEELTPALYRMATKGIQIEDYYQPGIAGTTGGEYSNIFGLLPTEGGKSMKIMTDGNPFLNLGFQLDKEGYYGKVYHNNNYKMYNRNETHEKLGYSDGFMGIGNGMEDFVSTIGFPESDLEMLEGSFPLYADKQPFNIYYMTVSGHGQYGRDTNYMSAKNYHRVENLNCSEQLKCYIANNLELEDAMAYLINALYDKGIADDTVVVISADHFPYNLDGDASLGNMPYLSELYGHDVKNYIDRDHNRLIIWSGFLENNDPIIVNSPVSSIDILPTLSNLFGVEYDSRLLPGRDIFSDEEAIIFTGGYDWKTDLGTYIASKDEFIPVDSSIEIPDNYISRIKSIVRNRFKFCVEVLKNDYYGHVYKALAN